MNAARSAIGISYGVLACVLTWPLPRHLRTDLLGPVSEDLGVYLWNLWIFRHELLTHHHLPLSTAHILGYAGPTDFALHNYAAVAGLLAFPLIPVLGLVGAFNIVLILCVALSGWATFMLARRLGLGTMAAWSAGALFMASPALVARQTAHFSLIIAAPLPLFLWALLRTLDTKRVRDAVLTGVTVALASYSDAYYGIYCILMGGFVVTWRLARLERASDARFPKLARGLEIAMVILVGLIAWKIVSGVSELTVGSVRIGLRTLHSPTLVLVLATVARASLLWRPRLQISRSELNTQVRLGLIAIASCVAVMGPVLVLAGERILTHQLPETVTYWRSSARGVDLLAYFVPNPNHPWFGHRTAGWFISEWADAFPEFVSSFSLVAFAIIAIGAYRGVLPRLWVGFTAFFFALSLGPFVNVAGINTYVIGPWALLRYVPVVELARSPSRFAIVVALGLSLLFAFSVEALTKRMRSSTPTLRYAFVVGLVTLLAFELGPIPRRLYSAAIPGIYQFLITTGEPNGKLLELPTGILDGTEMIGAFSASSQYYQTQHHWPLVGGYLSRVSRSSKAEGLRLPMLKVLFALSAGRAVTPAEAAAAIRARDRFLAQTCVKFVVVNKRLASPALQSFAVDGLKLTRVHEDEDYVLLTPIAAPPCRTQTALY